MVYIFNASREWCGAEARGWAARVSDSLALSARLSDTCGILMTTASLCTRTTGACDIGGNICPSVRACKLRR